MICWPVLSSFETVIWGQAILLQKQTNPETDSFWNKIKTQKKSRKSCTLIFRKRLHPTENYVAEISFYSYHRLLYLFLVWERCFHWSTNERTNERFIELGRLRMSNREKSSLKQISEKHKVNSQCKSGRFSSRWYLWAQKSPYSLHTVQRCFWNNLNIHLVGDSPFSSLAMAVSRPWRWHCLVLGNGLFSRPFKGVSVSMTVTAYKTSIKKR